MQLGLLLVATLLGQALSITPGLKDGQSAKKFEKDYQKDTRPVVEKNILNKIKTATEPYPALQSKSNFESDFVKDSNKDAGHWKAQFEYDEMRKKVLKEEADEKAAAAKAGKEGKDVAEAKTKADDAQKKADAAKKEADAAKAKEDASKVEKKEDKKETDTSQAELKLQLVKAEEQYEDQKKAFEDCKTDLEKAKTKYEDLMVQVEAAKKDGAAKVKFWAEQSDAKLKATQFAMEAASAKREAAALRFASAEGTKKRFADALAKEEAESLQANNNLVKEKAQSLQAKADLEKASQNLQKLRGNTPVKSGAAATAMFFSFVLSVAAVAQF